MAASFYIRQTPRWPGRTVRALYVQMLLLFILGLIAPAQPVVAGAPRSAAPRTTAASLAATAIGPSTLDAPPAPPPAPPTGDSCAAVLAEAQPAAHCLFGAIFLDGEPISGAQVFVRNERGEVDDWSAIVEGQSEPRYSIDLSAPPLSAQPGERVSVRVIYAGRVREVTHNVLPGQQRRDLVLPVGGVGDHILEQVLGREGEPGSFLYPYAIAASPTSDEIYVADQGNGQVHVFDRQGRFLRRWGGQGDTPGQLIRPVSIAVDTRNHVYVADRHTHRVTKFSAAGDLLVTFGITPGGADGRFQNPLAVAALGDQAVYIADASNGRIQRFTNDGAWEASFSSWDGGTFNVPTGLALDAAGDLYVADVGRNEILKFSVSVTSAPRLELQASWAAQGTLNPNANPPGNPYLQLSLDAASGRLYVVDLYGHRVNCFTLDGTSCGSIGAGGPGSDEGQFSSPYTAAVASEGQLYVVDGGNQRVQIFDAGGAWLASWGRKSRVSGSFSFPYDVAHAPDGRVYVVDSGNNRVQVLSSSGTFLTTWGSDGPGLNQFNRPFGIAVGPDDKVYVADASNQRIQRFNLDGSGGVVFPAQASLGQPMDVAVTVDVVYVLDYDGSRVLAFNRESGALLRAWGGPGSGDGQLAQPRQIAIGEGGRVFVADTGNHRVQVFTPDGTFVRSLGGSGSAPARLSFPYGVAVGDGLVFVADSSNNRIAVFEEATGGYLEAVGVPGSRAGHLYGVSLRDNGQLYISDQTNNRIKVLRPPSARAAEPVATIVQATPRVAAPGQPIRLHGAGASPAGTPINAYRWLLDGKPLSTEPSPTLDTTDLAHGRHSLSLVVQDIAGNQSEPQSLTFEVDACLGAGEGGEAPGCLLGSVILDGEPVDGARVEVTIPGVVAVEAWTEARPGEPYPTYRVDLGALGAQVGRLVRVQAFASGRGQEVRTDALAGRQRVDVVLPRTSPYDYALDKDFSRPGMPGTFLFPTSIAVDSRGNVYVNDRLNSRVQVFGPGGQFLRQWGTRQEGADQLDLPSGIAVDAQDNVYLTAFRGGRGRLLKFSPAGALLESWGGPGSPVSLSSPTDVAVAGDLVYVINGTQVVRIAPGTGEVIYWGTRSEEGAPPAPGTFASPEGIAVAPDSSVYVADTRNHRVQKFTADGAFVYSWGSHSGEGEPAAPGTFASPEGIAVDREGNIYVADRVNNRVQRLEAADAQANRGAFSPWVGGPTRYVDELARFFLPSDLAVDGQGRLYVIEPHNARYQVFDRRGAWQQSRAGYESDHWVDSGGTRVGRFFSPNGIAIDGNGDLIIDETGNRQVQKLTPEGEWLVSYGQPGLGATQFGFAQCVDLDAQDNMYICDGGPSRNRVQVLSPDGAFLRLWDGSENGRGDSGRLSDPRDIAVDRDAGVLYVADTGKGRIQKFSLGGNSLAVWDGAAGAGGKLKQPWGLAVDREGLVYVADLPDEGTGCIHKFTAAGGYLTHWCDGLRATRIDVGPDGLLYLSDGGANEIAVYTSDGTRLGRWTSNQLRDPEGVAFAADGTAYVVDGNASLLQRFRPMGELRPIATIEQAWPRVLAPGETLRVVGAGGVSDIGAMGGSPGGDLISYEWYLDGQLVAASKAAEISMNEREPGQHTLTLRVRDQQGLTSAPQTFSFVLAVAPLRVAPGATGDCRSAPCGSLAAALAAAAPGDTIALGAGVYQGGVIVEQDVTIVGAGPGATVLDGGHEQRVVEVAPGVAASLLGLTIRNGRATDGDGGGLLNRGELQLFDTVVAESLATRGGGIASASADGAIALTNSAVIGNRAAAGAGGLFADDRPLTLEQSLVASNSAAGSSGAIHTRGSLTIRDSTVSANVAISGYGGSGDPGDNINSGAIGIQAGSALIERSLIVGNRAEGSTDYNWGGAIANGGMLTISHSLIRGNAAVSHGTAAHAGAIANVGTALVNGSTLIENRATGPAAAGGAIYNTTSETTVGGLTIRYSTLALNTARARAGDASGGAVVNEGLLEIESSTLSDNRAISAAPGPAVGGGGALYNAGPATVIISASTIAGNRHLSRGGGLLNAGGPLTLRGSILADNHAPSGPDCGRAITSGGHNLIGDETGCDLDEQPSDLLNRAALLLPLADNGGPTPTRLPLLGSPAVDLIHSTCPEIDQRGASRPAGLGCDAGAVEQRASFETGFDPLADTYRFANRAGEFKLETFVKDFGVVSTTHVISRSEVIGDISGAEMGLPIAFGEADIEELLPIPIRDMAPGDEIRVPKPVAYLYEEVLVRRVYENPVGDAYGAAVAGGLCAGMAASVGAFKGGVGGHDPAAYVDPGRAPEARNIDYERVAELLHTFQGRQLSTQIQAHAAGPGLHSPRSLYRHLSALMTQPGYWQNPEILGVFKGAGCNDFEIGHAVLPYKIEPRDSQSARIYVYDPNYPSGSPERYIDLDLASNSWSFSLSEQTTWAGLLLISTPVKLFTEAPTLPYLSGESVIAVGGGFRGSWGGFRGSWGGFRGSWGVDGQTRTGCVQLPNGEWVYVEEIARSARLRPMSGAVPNSLLLPADQPLTFTGVSEPGATAGQMMLFGPGGVMGFIAETGSATNYTVSLDKEFRTLALSSSTAGKSLSAFQMHELPDGSATRFFAVSKVTMDTTGALELAVSENLEEMAVTNTADRPMRFTLGVATVSAEEVSRTTASYTLAPGETQTYTPDWAQLPESPIKVISSVGRATAGLRALYPFDDGGQVVHDRVGGASPLDLTIADTQQVRWSPDGLTILGPTEIRSPQPASALTAAIRQSGAFTLEAWVTPAEMRRALGSIVHLGEENVARNVALFQRGDSASARYSARVRVSRSGSGGLNVGPTKPIDSAGRRAHLVLTRTADGTLTLYVDGAPLLTQRARSSLATWDEAFPLMLANTASGDRAWLGTFHLIAIFDRALDPIEVQRHFVLGPDA